MLLTERQILLQLVVHFGYFPVGANQKISLLVFCSSFAVYSLKEEFLLFDLFG